MKIMILEDPMVRTVVVEYLEHFSQVNNVQFEILVAHNPTEAEALVGESDVALIEITLESDDLIQLALNTVGIPVIGISVFPKKDAVTYQSKKFRLIEKPAFNLAKFNHTMMDVVGMVQKKQRKAIALHRFREIMNEPTSFN